MVTVVGFVVGDITDIETDVDIESSVTGIVISEISLVESKGFDPNFRHCFSFLYRSSLQS